VGLTPTERASLRWTHNGRFVGSPTVEANDRSWSDAGQRVGVKQIEDKIWLVSFMRYDLGFFDHETCRIESAANP
jgi:hypothetical protein